MSRGVPVSVVDLTCVACSTMFVAHGPAADDLDALPAMSRLHRLDPSPVPAAVTPTERAELHAAAARHAVDAGWARRPDGLWACPRHADRYGGDAMPRRFTVREVLARHRPSGAPRS